MSDAKTAEKVICRMVESGVYEENARLKKEISRLLDQVEYEQQRNENNVSMADAEIRRLRAAILHFRNAWDEQGASKTDDLIAICVNAPEFFRARNVLLDLGDIFWKEEP